MNKLVSVIMPSYNSAKYIGRSVKSVLAQTYADFELIIVDDCSSDGTQDIVNVFLGDARVRFYINEKNSGAALSRNRALREAKGKYVAFLDSDDVWLPEKLEKQVAFMEKNGYAFTFTDYRICLNGEWLPYVNTAPDVVNKRRMYDYCYFSTITVMYDREKIGLVQIADLRKNNDYAMWLKIIQKSAAYRLPECLSYYIKHEGSVSSGSKLKLIKHHYIMWRKAENNNAVAAAFLTVRNLFWGVIKKLKYKRALKENEKNVTL